MVNALACLLPVCLSVCLSVCLFVVALLALYIVMFGPIFSCFRFQKNILGDPGHVLSFLFWVKPVCKGYQQTTKVADSK